MQASRNRALLRAEIDRLKANVETLKKEEALKAQELDRQPELPKRVLEP